MVHWIDPLRDEASMLQTNIKNYIEQSELQFITGNKDLNKDWDAYVKGLENLKMSRYLEILQKAYEYCSNKKITIDEEVARCLF